MVLQLSSILCGGNSSAHVFDAGDGTVIKLYTVSEDVALRQRQYAAERRAYAHATRHPLLKHHVPACFETPRVTDVIDASGVSVASKYELSFALRLERLSGPDLKFFELDDEGRRNAEWLGERFADSGLDLSGDESYFSWKRRDSIHVIDFADNS